MLLKSYPTIITHSVSAGALLCDATTANAFIAPTGIDFTPYRGKQIEIWSGSTLWARAWVSETAPTGDGAGAELLGSDMLAASQDFTSALWLVAATASKIDSDSFSTSAGGGLYKNGLLTTGNLYKGVLDGASGGTGLILSDSAGQISFGTLLSSKYATTTYTGVYFKHQNAGTTDITWAGTSIKQVLDPAPTGALLLSSNGGSRGYAYKHASFNPNAAVTLRVLATRVFSGNGSYIR